MSLSVRGAPPRRIGALCVLPVLPLALLASAGARAQTAPPEPTPERETRREFLDSLADSAIAPDPNQICRKRGARREIEVDERLKKGLTLRLRFSIDAALSCWFDAT